MILLVVEARVKPKSIKFISKSEVELVLTNVKLLKGDGTDLQRLDGEFLKVQLCDQDHRTKSEDELGYGGTGRLFDNHGGVVENVRTGDGKPIDPPHCWCTTCQNYELGEDEDGTIGWDCKYPSRWAECDRCKGTCPPGQKCPRFTPGKQTNPTPDYKGDAAEREPNDEQIAEGAAQPEEPDEMGAGDGMGRDVNNLEAESEEPEEIEVSFEK